MTNEDYLEAALALVAKARRSIDILAFSWGIGSVSGRMSFDGVPYKLAELHPQLSVRLKDRPLAKPGCWGGPCAGGS